MNNIIKTFNNSEFGSVRTLTLNGEPWFVGKDVASILGYSNPNEAIQDHVDSDDKFIRSSRGSEMLKLFSSVKEIQKQFGRQDNWFISESGLYSLIFGSKLPAAKAFKRWVTSEVLPTIRKTGSYTTPALSIAPPQASNVVGTAIYSVGENAKMLESIFALKHGMALAVSINMTQEQTSVDLNPLKKLVPAEEYPGYMNPTQVGEKLGGIRPVQVNKLLAEIGLQYKDSVSNSWRLTEDGKGYGEEKPYTNHGHSGYSIAWNDLVVKALRYKLDN